MKSVLLLAVTSASLLAPSLQAVAPPEQIKVPEGFKVELLREAGQRDGSWICMGIDDAGRLYISPQGSIPETGFAKDSKWGGLVRATVGEKGVEKWERVPVPVGDAMGMLWAFDSLYVSGQGPEGRGIYRCRDTDGDSIPESATMWKKVPGGAGEHGAHALVLGPDKKSIYIVHGNSTPLIEGIAPDSPYRNWGEDDLLPKLKDPVATFFDKIKAPYGYVLRTDENGTKWELMAGGFRNPYDIDFNADGELFTYDSDMEWDRGMPWYRPSRVLHVVPGGEYGFREGSAKWPDWYPDSLPPVVDIGLGCPTGVKFGTGAKDWGEKYQRAFFICDWTFGRVLAVHMKEKGASYTASNPLKSYLYPRDAEASGDVEVFLQGKGMPVTDVEFGKDGAMYLTVGGRGTAAGLYRVSPNQPMKTDVVAPGPKVPESSEPASRYSQLRLEFFVKGLVDGLGIKMLGDPDPFLRFVARGILEEPGKKPAFVDPVSFWAQHSKDVDSAPTEWLSTFLVSARIHPEQQAKVFEGLKTLPLAKLTDDLKLLKLRVIEVSLARAGRPSEEWTKTGLEKLLASYPAQGPEAQKLNRELSQTLIWLSNPELGDFAADTKADVAPVKDASKPVPNPGATIHPGRKGAEFHAQLGTQVIEKTLALLEAAPSQEEQIYYALCLRFGHGWTPEQRLRYFRWFHQKASRYTGGNSFAKFVDKIRDDAASRVPESERAALSQWLRPMIASKPVAPPKPRDFVKAWTLPELETALDGIKDRKPDLKRGEALYAGAQCAQCHLYKDTGGNVGPDLTSVSQRFGRKDILEAIIDPNKAVSDQYAMVTLTVTKFGGGGTDQVSGLVQEETSATITLLTDPVAGKSANFYTNVVQKREKANVSIMPPALLNTLTAEEVADLLAYMGAK